jgi:hypothetical protein
MWSILYNIFLGYRGHQGAALQGGEQARSPPVDQGRLWAGHHLGAQRFWQIQVLPREEGMSSLKCGAKLNKGI